jgi:hypothetical protein
MLDRGQSPGACPIEMPLTRWRLEAALALPALVGLLFPPLPQKDFEGKLRMGEFADSLAETDFRVSQIIDEIDVLDVADDSAGRWNQIDNVHIPLCAQLYAYHSHPFRQS